MNNRIGENRTQSGPVYEYFEYEILFVQIGLSTVWLRDAGGFRGEFYFKSGVAGIFLRFLFYGSSQIQTTCNCGVWLPFGPIVKFEKWLLFEGEGTNFGQHAFFFVPKADCQFNDRTVTFLPVSFKWHVDVAIITFNYFHWSFPFWLTIFLFFLSIFSFWRCKCADSGFITMWSRQTGTRNIKLC